LGSFFVCRQHKRSARFGGKVLKFNGKCIAQQ